MTYANCKFVETQNTVDFTMFHANDSWANLKTTLLQMFLFEDYKSLCKIFARTVEVSGKF